MILEPLYDWIILETELPKTESAGGFRILDPRPVYKGTVRAVGHSVKEIMVSDYVIHNKFSGIDFESDGISHKLLRENEIIVVLNRD